MCVGALGCSCMGVVRIAAALHEMQASLANGVALLCCRKCQHVERHHSVEGWPQHSMIIMIKPCMQAWFGEIRSGCVACG